MNINCRGKLFDLSKPIVMGILNMTPDSFYDGGQYAESSDMRKRIDDLVKENADIIDVGGMSSRPGANNVSVDDELKRVIPAIQYIAYKYPNQIISIDTMHSKVANLAISEGAHIINDISGGNYDSKIIDVAIENESPYILMHIQGSPKTMQDDPQYTDVTLEVLKYFNSKLRAYHKRGLKDIIIDPGFGFGKTIEHNYELLKNLSVFRITECHIMVGLSRKSMIYKPLKINSKDSLCATTALHLLALQNGAKILRVHDVVEAKQSIKLFELINGNK